MNDSGETYTKTSHIYIIRLFENLCQISIDFIVRLCVFYTKNPFQIRSIGLSNTKEPK